VGTPAGTRSRAVAPPAKKEPIAERLVLTTALDPYLSLKALANYAGLSVRKLRDHLDDPAHPLPCYRVGGKLLVRRSEFDDWMRAYRHRGRDVDGIVAEVMRGLS
jgi:excisionase family DNA binding protein